MGRQRSEVNTASWKFVCLLLDHTHTVVSRVHINAHQSKRFNARIWFSGIALKYLNPCGDPKNRNYDGGNRISQSKYSPLSRHLIIDLRCSIAWLQLASHWDASCNQKFWGISHLRGKFYKSFLQRAKPSNSYRPVTIELCNFWMVRDRLRQEIQTGYKRGVSYVTSVLSSPYALTISQWFKMQAKHVFSWNSQS